MQPFSKINVVDKDLYCEHIYNSYISKTSDFLTTCESVAQLLNLSIPIECYTNFRDALFHFRRMVQSKEENSISKQAFAVSEHANRAKTDAIVSILDLCNAILQVVSKKVKFEVEIRTELVNLQNKMSEFVLHRRLSGVMLNSANGFNPTEEEVISVIRDFYNFVSMNVEKETFTEVLKILDEYRKSYYESED